VSAPAVQRSARPTATYAASDVTVRFGGLVALNGVSLRIEPGTVHGVIGPNGAGKTTLFNVCCGFVQPQEGSLSWRGETLRKLRPHGLAKLGIARTLQGVGLFGGLTVLENVMVGADHGARAGFASALFGLPRSDADEARLRAHAWETLAELGAAAYAHRLPGTLPYPVQKRVALARALAGNPELLLLDEPASGLSEQEMSELGEIVLGLTSRMSIMLVEHHMDLVMRICDEITVLDFGEVIASGPPQEIREHPDVIAAYLGDAVAKEA